MTGAEEPLTVAEIEEAWKETTRSNWSLQRIVVAVLDAHGRALPAEEVVAIVSSWAGRRLPSPDVAHFRQRNSAVEVREDGWWAIASGPRAHEAVLAAREGVRERIDAETYRPEGRTLDPDRGRADPQDAATAPGSGRELRRLAYEQQRSESEIARDALDVYSSATTRSRLKGLGRGRGFTGYPVEELEALFAGG